MILFGQNIAKLVNDAITAAGGVLSASLIRETQSDSDILLTDAPASTFVRHACKGFMENRTDEYRGDTLVRKGGQTISILGDSLPGGIVPQAGDRIEIEDAIFLVSGVPTRDPAAAIYECSVSLAGESDIPVIPPPDQSDRAFGPGFGPEFG